MLDRVIQRDDDTAEKAKVRLETYHANIAAIKSCYEDITFSLDGAQPKGTVSLPPPSPSPSPRSVCSLDTRLDCFIFKRRHVREHPFEKKERRAEIRCKLHYPDAHRGILYTARRTYEV